MNARLLRIAGSLVLMCGWCAYSHAQMPVAPAPVTPVPVPVNPPPPVLLPVSPGPQLVTVAPPITVTFAAAGNPAPPPWTAGATDIQRDPPLIPSSSPASRAPPTAIVMTRYSDGMSATLQSAAASHVAFATVTATWVKNGTPYFQVVYSNAAVTSFQSTQDAQHSPMDRVTVRFAGMKEIQVAH
jgi:hypothetical protein